MISDDSSFNEIIADSNDRDISCDLVPAIAMLDILHICNSLSTRYTNGETASAHVFAGVGSAGWFKIANASWC